MAEGWTEHLKGRVIDPYSAGIVARRLNPGAVNVMQEAGGGYFPPLFSKDVVVCDRYSFRSCDHRV